jgi:HlyD family secretion protein
MTKKKKRIVWIIIIVVIVVVLAGINLRGDKETATMVQADLALLDNISEIVTASGRVQPQTKVDITSEVSAEIVAIFVKEGDVVERGQPLLLLDTVQYQSDVAQAQYSLDEIMARADAAKTQYAKDSIENERQARLFSQKLTSEQSFLDAKFAVENSDANFRAMKAQVQTQRARLEKAQDNLAKTRISAPMDGVVSYLSAEVGEIAQAQTSFTQGKTLMTIADLSVFEVEVDVDETEIDKLQLGQKADIRVDAFRDTSFAGSVVEIGNSAVITGEGTESYSSNFKVKVRFDQPEISVRPGMSATVDITTAQKDDALVVPYSAVVTREFDPDKLNKKDTVETAEKTSAASNEAVAAESSDQAIAEKDTVRDYRKKDDAAKVVKSGVFLVKNGKAEFIEIETGIADEQNIVALGGVQPGDTVISGSYQTLRKLEEGDPIQIDERSLSKMREE